MSFAEVEKGQKDEPSPEVVLEHIEDLLDGAALLPLIERADRALCELMDNPQKVASAATPIVT